MMKSQEVTYGNVFSVIGIFAKVAWYGIRKVIEDGKTDLLKKYIHNGGDVNRMEIRRPPIYYAVLYKQLECVKLLLEGGADPNVPDKNGETALHLAVQTGNAAAVDLLLTYGADPHQRDDENRTSFFFAQEKNNPAVLELLENVTIPRSKKMD